MSIHRRITRNQENTKMATDEKNASNLIFGIIRQPDGSLGIVCDKDTPPDQVLLLAVQGVESLRMQLYTQPAGERHVLTPGELAARTR